MERKGFYFKIKHGKNDEYKSRHDHIWPEIRSALTEAGISNYSIWNYEDMLFAYFETEDYQKSMIKLTGSSIYKKWREFMEDIIDFDTKTGVKEYSMDMMFFNE